MTSAFKALPWRRIMPVAGIAGVLWVAFDTGRDNERSKWQRASIAAERAAQAKSAALQAQVDAAGVALSEQAAAIDRLTKRSTGNVRTIYATRPADNLVCLGPDVLRIIADSDAADQDTSATISSPR